MADLFRVRHRECQCDKGPRVPVFEWSLEAEDEDDAQSATVIYDIAESLEAHVGLDYLEVLETRGHDAAARWMIVSTMGLDAWNALRSPGMTQEVFYGVLDVVRRRVLGSSNSAGPKA